MWHQRVQKEVLAAQSRKDYLVASAFASLLPSEEPQYAASDHMRSENVGMSYQSELLLRSALG